MPRQIGWSQESNLLYNISQQLDRLAAVTAASGGGGGGGGTITGGGAAGQVTFWDAATNITGSNNLFWDNATGRLGIGTPTPLGPINIVAADSTIFLRNTSPSGYGGINMNDDTNTLTGSFQIGGSGTGALAGHMFIGARKAAGNLLFVRGPLATLSAALFGATGNFLIQNGGTFSDAGYRLDVNGTSRFLNTLLITGTDNVNTANFIYRNSSGINQFTISNIGVVTARSQVDTPLLNSNQLQAQQNQNVLISAPWANSNNVTIQTYFNAANGLIVNHTGNVVRTTGGNVVIQATETFAPTSGNATTILALLNPTINQVGATGITRGLYVNPTLTAAADWRSIEISNNTGWAIYATGTAPSLFNGDVSIAGKLALTVTANRQTVNYSLVLADNGKLVEMNVGAANTLTVPPNSSITFPIGTKIDIAQYGAGQTSIVPGAGVTVRSALGALKLAAQYSGASLVKIGTDEWYLFGDITV